MLSTSTGVINNLRIPTITALKSARARAASVLCLTLLIPISCGLREVKQQVEQIENVGVLVGQVDVLSPENGPVIVSCYRYENDAYTLESTRVVEPDGSYRFRVIPGNFLVTAYIDVSRDGQFQRGEPGNFHLDPLTLAVGASEVVKVADLTISGDPPRLTKDVDAERRLPLIAENLGKVVSLDDPAFARANYSLGMWRPLDFLDRVGGGLMFLRTYDANRMPVIFVHGINGGPNDWRTAIAQLNGERYQPWIFYYPSGLRLDMVSSYLVLAIEELRLRYGSRSLPSRHTAWVGW